MTKAEVYQVLEEVPDPEIPVISILDLGIVRDVAVEDDEVTVTITPTYTGCPAMDWIAVEIKVSVEEAGAEQCEVKTVLYPPWTTDWLSESGRRKLREYGIAPPVGSARTKKLLLGDEVEVACPHCSSSDTVPISEFGSTPCKALYRCSTCQEPFDYFKCH